MEGVEEKVPTCLGGWETKTMTGNQAGNREAHSWWIPLRGLYVPIRKKKSRAGHAPELLFCDTTSLE
jgi:hypothetical protein